MEIEEEHRVPVSGRESEDGAADGFVAAGLLEGVAGDARIVGLGNFVERERQGGDAADLGAVEIVGQGEEPGGEGRLAAELREFAEGAEERFLGHFFGAAAVMAETPGQIDERRLPAAHDALEGCSLAGKEGGDQSGVFGGRFGRWVIGVHVVCSWPVRPQIILRGFVFSVEPF